MILSMHDGKSKRKYAHTLEMIQPEESGAWVRSYFLVRFNVALYWRVQQFSTHHAMSTLAGRHPQCFGESTDKKATRRKEGARSR